MQTGTSDRQASTFSTRLQRASVTGSTLCVGLDPSVDQLRAWGLPVTAEGARDYCERLVDACEGSVCLIKPQYAFFEQFGPAGIEVLCRIMRRIKDADALAILDCKRGDIGSTMEAYGAGILGPDSQMHADAMTAVAYLGVDALGPLFQRAAATGTAVFVVLQSSNPEGVELQAARCRDGRTVAETIADAVRRENDPVDGMGHVGVVIGATSYHDAHDLSATLERLSDTWILAPGIGAQGATIDELPKRFGNRIRNVIPSVSRGIAAAGPDRAELSRRITELRDQALRVCG